MSLRDTINQTSGQIAEQIARASESRTPQILRAGGGRQFYGNPAQGEHLELKALSGVLEYEPSELFLSAAAATPLPEIEALLAKNDQMLAFEPPHFSGTATAGGALACGLSGPRRPSGGALRDHVLGVAIIDGRGQRMEFGGKVIKNVAGFDVSRLMAGALGVLGVIAEVIFRVSPLPENEITIIRECSAQDAIAEDNQLLARGLPLTGGAWHDGKCWRRFSGGTDSLRRAAEEAGGDVLSDADHRAFWHAVREHQHPFFNGKDDLWRVAAPPLASVAPQDEFIEWHGAVRWRRGDSDARAAAERAGGAASLFRAADPTTRDRFSPPPRPLQNIYRRVKKAFDPANILNRGRLFDFGNDS